VVGLGEHRGDGQPLAGLGRDLELEGLSRPDVADTEGLSSSSTRFNPTKSKAYPVLSDVDLPRKWPWEDHGKTSKVPRFLGAPTCELSAPVTSPMAERGYSRRPLLANAAIAASRVGS